MQQNEVIINFRQKDTAGALQKVNSLIEKIRHSVSYFKDLPLIRPEFVFDLATFQYRIVKTESISFNLGTLALTTRITALLLFIKSLLEQGSVVTKRCAYYHLLKFYQNHYEQMSEDLRLLALNLGVRRDQLNIVASGKGIISGGFEYALQDISETKNLQLFEVLNLQPMQKILIVRAHYRYVVIVEKESIFNMILSNTRAINYQEYLLITAKGYPDFSTQEFVAQAASSFPDNVFYLGDLDPHGFEILLIYTFGSPFQGHGVPSIRWLMPQQLIWMGLIDQQEIEQEYLDMTQNDAQKLSSVCRKYFNKASTNTTSNNSNNSSLEIKLQKWHQKMTSLGSIRKKIEQESFFKLARTQLDLIKLMIDHMLYI